jgi:hypothetical protein
MTLVAPVAAMSQCRLRGKETTTAASCLHWAVQPRRCLTVQSAGLICQRSDRVRTGQLAGSTDMATIDTAPRWHFLYSRFPHAAFSLRPSASWPTRAMGKPANGARWRRDSRASQGRAARQHAPGHACHPAKRQNGRRLESAPTPSRRATGPSGLRATKWREGVRFCQRGVARAFAVRARRRDGFRAFLRSFAGIVARKVTGASRGRPLPGGRFWRGLAWSRIVNWGRDYWGIRNYIFRNLIEATAGAAVRHALEQGPGESERLTHGPAP